MAGKYALYLPYKVLDSLSSGNVTDSEFREFIMGLAEYDKSGVFPASHTAGFTMMFELLKTDLNFAKAKYEDIIEKRRIAGQQGGAPIGNQNAARNLGGGAPLGNQNAKRKAPGPDVDLKNKHKQNNQMLEFELKQTQPKQPTKQPTEKTNSTEGVNSLSDKELTKQTQAKQAKQADNSSQLKDNSSQLKDKRNSSSSSAAPAGDGGVVSAKQPQTTTTDSINIQNFLEASKNAGFTLDRKAAERILDNEGFRHWINGRFNFLKNFLKYTAQRIKSDPRYADKPDQELKRLFISALSWEDFRYDYLEWRKEAERKTAEEAERRRIEQARENVPKTCPKCGCAITNKICEPCNGMLVFDEKNLVYALDIYPSKSLPEEFRKLLWERHVDGVKSGAIQPEEIEF